MPADISFPCTTKLYTCGYSSVCLSYKMQDSIVKSRNLEPPSGLRQVRAKSHQQKQTNQQPKRGWVNTDKMPDVRTGSQKLRKQPSLRIDNMNTHQCAHTPSKSDSTCPRQHLCSSEPKLHVRCCRMRPRDAYCNI